ncbi:hypothetical protein V6Z11_D04G134800 [Gossypium hirsutum]|uniref:Reverse transcriptase zinc-binding domain-containing protein n=1 Tax=Gossypium hirsutum TaxID=3635 RepID=A0ABM2ZWV8_GOSHI|nr:uncharacterized protein LOC121216031 [Gossypium hirsutum]
MVCGEKVMATETLEHIFHDCPSNASIWVDLQITWPSEISDSCLQDWLFYIVQVFPITLSRKVGCALWFIWNAWNQHVHNNAIIQMHVLIQRVEPYLLELDVVYEKLPGRLIGPERWRSPDGCYLKINFDAAFHSPSRTSCAGVVI